MSASIMDMAARLAQKVLQRSGAPASYHACIREAVAQYGHDAPLIRQISLDIRAGVDAYDLPEDFSRVIGLSVGAALPGVVVSAGGLLPTSLTHPVRPRYVIQDGQIVFIPAPAYAAVWLLRYAAHYQESTGVYPALDANGSRIALFYAEYLALGEQAHSLGVEAWSYTIGAESIDRSKIAGSVRTEADAALRAYHDALRGLRSPGLMGRCES